ncbi:hypothetical protein DBB36_14450 [Flavobacterium sp. WLB]|nr:hypothetical protein AKO67_03390 [Flavobacterium sp. VMW]OWU90162.1 hypothetical protein APR43_13870 [Flavobacterium sp. NLM]PUU69313.1 hypothetical protein DBB36_14450 [Flavobacterium sp. WLB]
MDKYQVESSKLLKAIDIEINVLQKFPPIGWDKKAVSEVVAFNLEIKENVLNPEFKFLRVSLKSEVGWFKEYNWFTKFPQ